MQTDSPTVFCWTHHSTIMPFYDSGPAQDHRTPPAPLRLALILSVFPLPVPAKMQVEVSWIEAPCLSPKPHHPSEFQSPALAHQTLSLPVVEISWPPQTPRSTSMHLANLETLALTLSTLMEPWHRQISPRIPHAGHRQALPGHMSGTWVAPLPSQTSHLVSNMTSSLFLACFNYQPIQWLCMTHPLLVIGRPGWTEFLLPDLSANR